ncbi:MAG TPA: aminodeoxychorismate synthase component I [Rhizomicrobium sp.]|nr:aminodeoxychorismate synthase component I [Rhizomicrobium sp.]
MILLDDSGRTRRFSAPESVIVAHAPGDVPGALAALEAARQAGKYAAGYFSYELGYLLEPRLRPPLPAARAVPLLWFGIFNRAEEGIPATQARAYAGPLVHEWDEAGYTARFARIHEWIAAGDIYQANLSFRSRFHFLGDPLALYLNLRAQSGAAHCAYIDDGERQILSLSPELFFDLSVGGKLTARPMKGTAARGVDFASDEIAKSDLQSSAKNRAENLMIVDLLRNDLGRVAETGSVKVANLFEVETYPTVHQMVSTIDAQLKPGMGVEELVRALFPCGSVTGAPKIRAMEVIREMETSPRGIYCGAIGHFAPDGSANFNVAIRTLTICGNRGELGIGGAIVHDSNAPGEYAECLLKARYYEAGRKPLELIETLRHAPGEGFTRLELHLARMSRSAAAFGIPFDTQAAMRALEGAALSTPARMRLTLNEDGKFNATSAVLSNDAPSLWKFAVSPIRIASSDQLQGYKTSWREIYDSEYARAAREGFDEIIFLNEKDEVVEASRTNIFARMGGTLVTPPLSSGALDGCLRRALIEEGQCNERILTLADLAHAEEIFLGNSLRGLIRAVAV